MNPILEDIKTIESEINKLHKEALGIIRHNEARSHMVQQDLNSLEENYNRSMSDIDALQRSYQNKISDNQNIISQIHQMIGMLPEKLVRRYTPQSVTCPTTVDIEYLGTLFENITTDTMSSAIKRFLKKDGNYKYEDMVRDFLRLSAEAESFLVSQISQLKNESIRAISIKRKYAEDEKNILQFRHDQLEQKLKEEEVRETRELVLRRNKFFETDLITCFHQRLSKYLCDCGCADSDWIDYNVKRERNYRLVLGNSVVPFITESESLQKKLIDSIPQYAREGCFDVPFVVDTQKPLKIYWQFLKNDKKNVAKQIQIILLRLVRSAPVDSFDIYFIDPCDRGSNLGILNAPFELNQKIGIYVRNSKDEIRDTLKELESYINEINAKIGTCSSVSQFNQQGQSNIKEKILVIYDFPEYFGTDDVEILKVIVNNARKCGVHILFATDKSLEDIKLIFKDYKVDWTFLENSWIKISTRYNKIYLTNGCSYKYCFEDLKACYKIFIDTYRKKYEEGLTVDNLFADILSYENSAQLKDATDGLRLPVMVRNAKGGGIYELNVGTSNSTHTLITGNTSSGKSTFLHMIISSIIMNYHPDDVELWLVDYGRVEFNIYYKNMPPHVRLISLEKSAEFTYSFLDFLKSYFSEREKLFGKVGVSNIKEYRMRFGQLSMPRVVLIIDEFHNMTQHVQASVEYRTILENALAEYRKFGLSCIFSNQTISGLQGLTEVAKLQIRNRIALSNELNEMKDTIAVSTDNYTDDILHKMERTAVGELWFKEWISRNDFMIRSFKGIYISELERKEILNKVINKNYTIKNDSKIIKINSSEREQIPLDKLQNYFIDQNFRAKFESFSLILGTPSTLDDFFILNIERKYNQNVLLIGRDLAIKRDIITSIILNLSIQKGFRIIIFADGTDPLFLQLKKDGCLRSKTCVVEIFDRISDICIALNKIISDVDKRLSQIQPTFIMWFGMRDIFDEFKVSPNKESISYYNSDKNTSIKTSISEADIEKAKNDPECVECAEELGITVEEMLQSLVSQAQDTQPGEMAYNAIDDTVRLFEKGSKLNIYNFVSLDSGFELEKLRGFRQELFCHKLVMNLSKEEFIELSVRQNDIILDEVSLLYTDGIKSLKFKPFIIKG